MKKRQIFTIIAFAIAALFLGCVALIGAKSGFFGIASLVGAKSDTALPMISYETTWNPDEYEVYGLDVEWINGEVSFSVTDSDVIRITELSGRELKDKDRLSLSRDSGILKIKWKDELISFSIFHNKNKDLTIEVPRKLAEGMEELTCTTTSGKITAAGFTAEEIKISSTSGSLQLSSVSGETGEISTVSGKIDLTRAKFSESINVSSTSGEISLENVRTSTARLSTTSGAVLYRGDCENIFTDSVSGSVYAELAAAPKAVNMEAVSGSLTLLLPHNSGFDAEFSSISGSFKTDFDVSGTTGAKSGRVLCRGGDGRLSFKTTSGEISVLKK